MVVFHYHHHSAKIINEVGQAIALLLKGGKSGLHRVECQVTPGRCEPTESATENIPPEMVRVKWCGKSAPHNWQQLWQGKPHLEQDQIEALGLSRRMTHAGLG